MCDTLGSLRVQKLLVGRGGGGEGEIILNLLRVTLIWIAQSIVNLSASGM